MERTFASPAVAMVHRSFGCTAAPVLAELSARTRASRAAPDALEVGERVVEVHREAARAAPLLPAEESRAEAELGVDRPMVKPPLASSVSPALEESVAWEVKTGGEARGALTKARVSLSFHPEDAREKGVVKAVPLSPGEKAALPPLGGACVKKYGAQAAVPVGAAYSARVSLGIKVAPPAASTVVAGLSGQASATLAAVVAQDAVNFNAREGL